MDKVLIFTDRINGKPRRGCYWTNEFLAAASRTSDSVSIAEEIAAGRNPANTLFSKDYDEVVVNWDAINGDPVYASDIAQAFFRHYQPDLFRWLRQGNKVLLVESQRAAETATREAYEAISPLPVPPITPGDFQGRIVFTNDGKQYSAPGKSRNDLFTPPGSFLSLLNRSSISGTLYRGCFDQVKDPWIPVLFGADKKGIRKPVAIVNPMPGDAACGALVLTTLHIAEVDALPVAHFLLDLRHSISTLRGERTREARNAFLKELERVFIDFSAQTVAAAMKNHTP